MDAVYTKEWNRIIQAVLIDSRDTSMPNAANGNDIKVIVDSEINKIDDNVIFYKLENNNGVLIGYFSILINGKTKSGILHQFQLRKAYYSSQATIKRFVYDYINYKLWECDYLFKD